MFDIGSLPTTARHTQAHTWRTYTRNNLHEIIVRYPPCLFGIVFLEELLHVFGLREERRKIKVKMTHENKTLTATVASYLESYKELCKL